MSGTPLNPESLHVRHGSQRWHFLWLLGIAFIHVAIRVWGFSGIHDADELAYNEAARQLRIGEYINPSPYGVRYIVIVPLAISQVIFGINEYASAVPPMLYSLACLMLVYLIGKAYADRTVGLIAAGLWSFTRIFR